MIPNDEKTSPWPRDFATMRWVIVVASLIGLGQAIPLFVSRWGETRPDVDVYYHLVFLVLMGAACVAAWQRRARAFVLLAVGGQMVNAFMTGFAVISCVTLMARWGTNALRGLMPLLAWNLLVLGFAVTVIGRLVRRHVRVE